MVNTSNQLIKQKSEKSPLKNNASDKKRRQEKRSLQRIAADILESIDDYISAFDRNWNIIYINKTTAKDFGCKPEGLMGKNFWKTFPHFIGSAVEELSRDYG